MNIYLYACPLYCYWSIQNTEHMDNEQDKVCDQYIAARCHTKDKTASQDILSVMYSQHTSDKLEGKKKAKGKKERGKPTRLVNI